MMSELVPLKQQAATLRNLFEERKGELARALPRHLPIERFMRLILTACTRTPRLFESTPASVYGAVMQAAQLGLEIDVAGQAHLIPFRNKKTGNYEAQLIPGYKGLIALARRSGEISTISARAVFEKDYFDYKYSLEKDTLDHKPCEEENRGELSHVYAIARLKDGGIQWEVMPRSDVERVRKQARAGNDGPWVTHYEEMAKKTVLRRLCKLLPSSVELQTAIALDEHADAGIPQTFDVQVIPDVPDTGTAPSSTVPPPAPPPPPAPTAPPPAEPPPPIEEPPPLTDYDDPKAGFEPEEPPTAPESQSQKQGEPPPAPAERKRRRGRPPKKQEAKAVKPGVCPECERYVSRYGHRADCKTGQK
jgi:recombination protein RecT